MRKLIRAIIWKLVQGFLMCVLFLVSYPLILVPFGGLSHALWPMRTIPPDIIEKSRFAVVTRDVSTDVLRERMYDNRVGDIERLREGKESLDVPETEKYKKVIMESGYQFHYKARRQKDGVLEVHLQHDTGVYRYTVKDGKVVRLATKWDGAFFYHGVAWTLIFWGCVFVYRRRKKRREALERNPKLGEMSPVNT